MNPPPNFNPLARLYRWMEFVTFGPWLSRCRCAFLHETVEGRRALVYGDGDGRFTASLLHAAPILSIDTVDASSAMLHALLRRAGRDAARIRAYHADARAFRPPNPPYDLIATHFFLDCLSTAEIRSLATTLRASAAPQAHWIISEFAVPPNLFGRLVARPLVWFLYRVFGLLTGLNLRELPDHHAALSQSGFILKNRRSWLRGLLVSELWAAPPTKTAPLELLQSC